jgi:short-subunit dehydrogenase
MGTVHLLVNAGRRMPQGTRIICVSSVAGLKGLPEFAGYCASKFAVYGFCESIYHDLKKKGIDLSVLCPPAVDTPMVRNLPSRPTLYEIFPFAEKKAVVDSIISAIGLRDRFLILVDAQSTLLRKVNGIAPETLSTLFVKIIDWKRKRTPAASPR